MAKDIADGDIEDGDVTHNGHDFAFWSLAEV